MSKWAQVVYPTMTGYWSRSCCKDLGSAAVWSARGWSYPVVVSLPGKLQYNSFDHLNSKKIFIAFRTGVTNNSLCPAKHFLSKSLLKSSGSIKRHKLGLFELTNHDANSSKWLNDFAFSFSLINTRQFLKNRKKSLLYVCRKDRSKNFNHYSSST